MADKQHEDDFENFDNAIKKIIPEFNSATSMLSGRVSNFAQKQLGETLSKGVVPEGDMPPVLKNLMIKEMKI